MLSKKLFTIGSSVLDYNTQFKVQGKTYGKTERKRHNEAIKIQVPMQFFYWTFEGGHNFAHRFSDVNPSQHERILDAIRLIKAQLSILSIELEGGTFYFQFSSDKLYLIFANGLQAIPSFQGKLPSNQCVNIFDHYSKKQLVTAHSNALTTAFKQIIYTHFIDRQKPKHSEVCTCLTFFDLRPSTA